MQSHHYSFHFATEEVKSMQAFAQKLYAQLLTLTEEKGQTMAEYGVVLALITLAVVATLGLLGVAINGKLNGVLDALTP
jgi:Flp pilus assembly pilin Flp